MLNRRNFLAAAALTATLTMPMMASTAQAADWSKDYPEIVLGVIQPKTPRPLLTVMRLWPPISARNLAPRSRCASPTTMPLSSKASAPVTSRSHSMARLPTPVP